MGLRQTMSKFWLGDSEDEYPYDGYDNGSQDTWQQGYGEENDKADIQPVAEVTQLPTAQNQRSQRRRIVTVRPVSFEEATRIATVLREGDPVIMNLSEAAPDLARRMLDFAAGVVYVLDGGVETITSRVYLLSPGGYAVDSANNSDSGFLRR